MRDLLIIVFIFLSTVLTYAQHPSIIITADKLQELRKGCTVYPLLSASYQVVKDKADKALTTPVAVPVPKDGGGGATHEQHKRNYQDMVNCGLAYQVSADKKYAGYVAKLLTSYADQYEQWPLHPARKEHQVPGKIFWQNLNDCVWAVYSIQAYDLVYDALTAAERKHIEAHLFRPVLKFLTEDSKKTFDKVHNHGTWCAAAVGMIGYVLKDQHYVDMALYGSNKDKKTGYFAMLDELFSPDGYYTEGPYYQRYAMLPFIVFAKTIHQYQPGLNIYQYRNGLLSKAINTTLQLTYTNGAFFPINDAIKDKTFKSEEIVYCVDIAYADIKAEAGLLDIARQQERVLVSDAGLQVAKDIAANKAKPFQYTSQLVYDGKDGNEGALAIMRNGSNEDQQCVVIKAAGHGMGHGHFDQLNLLYYDNGTEVFSDYGAARFLNINSKYGGDYLPENKTWGKQTIAHNTVVVDRQSQFNADAVKAQQYHSALLYFAASDSLTVSSFTEENAFPGTALTRTTLLFQPGKNEKALLIDVYHIKSGQSHSYDLPFWYQGHIVASSFAMNMKTDQLGTMGQGSGYQHLWLNQQSALPAEGGHLSLLNKNRFYTTHFTTTGNSVISLVTLGANDRENDLRNEKAFILNAAAAKDYTFFTLTETHGRVNPTEETATGTATSVSQLKIINSNEQQTECSFRYGDRQIRFAIHYKEQQNFIEFK